MLHLINIDWLTLHCEPKINCEQRMSIISAYYHAELLKYGNRFYKHMLELKQGKQVICVISYCPYSPILPANSTLIRFDNRVLYMPNLPEIVDCVLQVVGVARAQCTLSRVDLCCDFNLFDNGMHPLTLIKGLASHTLRKVGKSKFALYGVQSSKGNFYTGIRYGVHGSDESIYLYNKSLELSQKVDKPYIRDCWVNTNLDTHSVWRLEVSLNPKVKQYVSRETGDIVSLNLDTLFDNLPALYNCLVSRLWQIVPVVRTDSNISRAKRLPLLNITSAYPLSPLREISNSSTYDKGVINYLRNFTDKHFVDEREFEPGYNELLNNAAFCIRRILSKQ